ncbi:MAG: ribonuclease III [Firmicutes bacterium]|nr:ribonuclease III [Bacillota bacterium]
MITDLTPELAPELTPGGFTPLAAANLPALTLAYIGDAVYELRVRRHLLDGGCRKVQDMHKQSVALVRAETQSRLLAALEPQLTEAEADVARRGRNAKGSHQPPHVPVAVYRRATGLEALIGYLWLLGEESRLDELFAVLFSLDLSEA